MKCPYCNEDLKEWDRRLYCENMACSANHEDLPQFIWQDLIDGKKAQRQLQTVKDSCVKKINAKEREITSCLNGIYIRQSENERLAKKLKKAWEALELFSTIKIESQQRASLYDDILGHPVIVLARIRDIARGTIADITQQDIKER